MDENVIKCYFYILRFPEQKKPTNGISYISTMVTCFPEISKYYFEK